jgi:predicted transposase YdaD
MGVATRIRKRHRAAPGHDPGYKRLFSHRCIVEDLLRGFLPTAWSSRLDFSSLKRVGNSFVSDDLRERHSDLIWRLRLRDEAGDWTDLYLLLEFQSTSDPFMAVRLLTYAGLLYEDIIRNESLKPGDRLPAVLPLVFHNGKRPWRALRNLGSLLAPLPFDLRRRLPRLTYLVLDQRRLDLDRPALRRNRAAALFRIETCETLDELLRQYEQLARLVSPEEEPDLWRTVNAWVIAVARRTFPGAIVAGEGNLEETPMLEENMIAWREKFKKETLQEGLREGRQKGHQQGRREGRREGRQEGLAEGMQKLILQLMTQRFGRLPAAVRKRVEEISSIQELRKLGRRILRASSLEEMRLG